MEDKNAILNRLNSATSPEDIMPDLVLMFAIEMEQVKKRLDWLEQYLTDVYSIHT